MSRRRVILVQLPIPPVGPQPIRGNVPLAAGYLALHARRTGLASGWDVEIFPPFLANLLSDEALARELADRRPDLVGFTTYLWNIDRSLWVARRLRERWPKAKVLLGGPEITADNQWVLGEEVVDFAAIGEGEQTFAELLAGLSGNGRSLASIPGLFVRGRTLGAPPPRAPLPMLDAVSSPYLEGLLDAADEGMMMLETLRGCVFKCKFCYYPKSYDDLYFLSEEKIVANLLHARQRGAREVVLLDPTLNQRAGFDDFLMLLARENPDRQFTYFGELRAEGVTPRIARLLREANFNEVEVGLQTIDPHAQTLMDRKNNLKAVERGVHAMLGEGIRVKVDLILGLPGDTVESVRAGIGYLKEGGLGGDVQVFHLSILPGTSFRQEASALGLRHQPRPPYYVLGTPTLELGAMIELMQEAQDAFGIEFDPLPPPTIEWPRGGPVDREATVDLDGPGKELPAADRRSLAFRLRLRSSDFGARRSAACQLVRRILSDSPHTTLEVVLEPAPGPKGDLARTLPPSVLAAIADLCQETPSYLDRFFALQPGSERPIGAKRLFVVLPQPRGADARVEWREEVGGFAEFLESAPPGGPANRAAAGSLATGPATP